MSARPLPRATRAPETTTPETTTPETTAPETTAPDLSVIVPLAPGDGPAPELIAALDGLDSPPERLIAGPAPPAPPPGWRAVATRPGRAAALNDGAAAARGAGLWFLHADSRLGRDPGADLAALRAALAARPDALHYFDLRFSDGPPWMRLNAAGAWLRCRLLGLPFGDQGLALRRDRFQALGGYPEDGEPGEDHRLVWRARKAGLPARALGRPLGTSARRYEATGWLRLTLRYQALWPRQAWAELRRRPEPQPRPEPGPGPRRES